MILHKKILMPWCTLRYCLLYLQNGYADKLPEDRLAMVDGLFAGGQESPTPLFGNDHSHGGLFAQHVVSRATVNFSQYVILALFF